MQRGEKTLNLLISWNCLPIQLGSGALEKNTNSKQLTGVIAFVTKVIIRNYQNKTS